MEGLTEKQRRSIIESLQKQYLISMGSQADNPIVFFLKRHRLPEPVKNMTWEEFLDCIQKVSYGASTATITFEIANRIIKTVYPSDDMRVKVARSLIDSRIQAAAASRPPDDESGKTK
jgi:hypothetical protein